MSDEVVGELKRLPLHERHVKAGGKMVPFAGHEMAVSYTGIKEEHHAVRQRVGLFDVSHMGEVRIKGPGALDVVNHLITQDMKTAKDGQARYAVMCHPNGGIVDDLVVYRVSAEEVLICVNASNRAKDFEYMKAHALPGAELTDESDQWAQLALQGPRAQALLGEVTTGLDVAGVEYYHFGFGDVAGVPCMVSRTGYTGEDGFELYIPVERAGEVFDALVQRGEAHGLALCGLGCRDTLRLEARYPLYGQDLTDDINPLEAGLGWVVKLDKADDFLGKEALKAIQAEGVKRRLRGFVMSDRNIPRAHYAVMAGEAQVGELTSGSFSPTLDVGIALGYVEVAHAGAESLDIVVRGRRIPARVMTKPFYKRA